MRQTDECFVRHTLDLARLGTDTAPPNPLVGALIVDSAGTVLGSGWHRVPARRMRKYMP